MTRAKHYIGAPANCRISWPTFSAASAIHKTLPSVKNMESSETQPRPTGIEAAVCADIAARQALGVKKYGTTVAANPLPLKAWLQHAYEETLDQAVYLKRAIQELP